jgi:hypothetical protein
VAFGVPPGRLNRHARGRESPWCDIGYGDAGQMFQRWDAGCACDGDYLRKKCTCRISGRSGARFNAAGAVQEQKSKRVSQTYPETATNFSSLSGSEVKNAVGNASAAVRLRR